LGDDFFEVGAFDFLEAGACLVLGDLAAAEAFEVGLTFEVGFAPVASFLGDTLLEGRFFALVAALGADFFAVVDLTVAFEAVDLTAVTQCSFFLAALHLLTEGPCSLQTQTPT